MDSMMAAAASTPLITTITHDGTLLRADGVPTGIDGKRSSCIATLDDCIERIVVASPSCKLTVGAHPSTFRA